MTAQQTGFVYEGAGARIDVPWPRFGNGSAMARLDSRQQLDAFREAQAPCRAVSGATTGTDPHG